MEEKNYAKKAANWWATKIRNSTDSLMQGIVPFELLLERNIRTITSLNGHMKISTYNCRSKLLDEVAMNSHLYTEMPIGYEMQIIFNQVYVYDSSGQLIESF